MQQMLLATTAAEYDFTIQYLPGTRNIIADYGTRQIDVSEWDKPLPDDPEGLHSVLAFEVSLATDEQLFHESNMCQHDFDVLGKLKLPYNNKNDNIWIKYRQRPCLWLPHNSKRPYFLGSTFQAAYWCDQNLMSTSTA